MDLLEKYTDNQTNKKNLHTWRLSESVKPVFIHTLNFTVFFFIDRQNHQNVQS